MRERRIGRVERDPRRAVEREQCGAVYILRLAPEEVEVDLVASASRSPSISTSPSNSTSS